MRVCQKGKAGYRVFIERKSVEKRETEKEAKAEENVRSRVSYTPLSCISNNTDIYQVSGQ